MNTIHKGITTLLASAVTGEKRQLPPEFTLEAAMPIIKRQNLEPLAFQGALNCGISEKEPAMVFLMKKYLGYLLHSEKQMAAVQKLFDAFEENGIDYLPLKGCNMKALYPKSELRTMGDADILIRFGQYSAISRLMKKMGYSMVRVGPYDHEWKCDNLKVELHRRLVSPNDGSLYTHLGNGWDRAEKKRGHRYCFRIEDDFIYQFAHMTKHFRHDGIGSRHFLDLYVYLRAHKDMDEVYIAEAMKQLRLLEFYKNVRCVLDVWFEEGEPDPITEYITSFVFSSGSWGTWENGASSEVILSGTITNSKSRSLVTLLFPPVTTLSMKYPILENYPVLYPAVWLWRCVQVIRLLTPQQIRKKVLVAAAVSDEKVLKRQLELEYVGLDVSSGEN